MSPLSVPYSRCEIMATARPLSGPGRRGIFLFSDVAKPVQLFRSLALPYQLLALPGLVH